MAWTPQWPATDIRAIVNNLLTFFAANQADALLWAHGSALTGFTYYPTAEMRMKTDFPHFGVVRRRTETAETEDGLIVDYRLTFEFEAAITHSLSNRSAKLLELQREIDDRAVAIESMFLNIPAETLSAGAGGLVHMRVITSSDPLEVAISDTKSLFNVEMTAALRLLQ